MVIFSTHPKLSTLLFDIGTQGVWWDWNWVRFTIDLHFIWKSLAFVKDFPIVWNQTFGIAMQVPYQGHIELTPNRFGSPIFWGKIPSRQGDWIVSIGSVDTFSVPASNNSQIFSSCVHLFSSCVQSATFSLICLVLWQHCLFHLLHPILIVSHRHHHFYPLLLLLRAR